MTAIPSFNFPDMEGPHLDDKMDVGSSPFRQPNDVDIDLESVRDPSVIGSVHDEMIDDFAVPADTGLDIMQDPFDDTFADDDMYDDMKQDPPGQHDTDYNMDETLEQPQGDEDEDILYEDEEEIRPIDPQNNESVEYSEDPAPQDYYEADAEVIPEELDRQPEQQEQDPLAANESDNLPLGDLTNTGEQLAEAHEQSDRLEGQSLDTTTGYNGEQGETIFPQEQTGQDHKPAEELEHPEQSVSSERSIEPENKIQDTQAATESESVAPADNEVSKERHEESTNSKQGDDTTKSVHPVTVVYLEDEMSLFPPMLGDATSIYFLPDSSLAFGPLDLLLAACRDILDGTLDHHDELVLDVPALGLHICEDSKYAAQITLAQILEVYLHLCHNDEGQEIRPLYCHLSSRVSLASQYAYLASASGEGKTYAEIAADHLDSPEPESRHAEVVDESDEQQHGGNQLGTDGQVKSTEEHVNDKETAHEIQDGQSPDAPDLLDQPQEHVATESVTQLDMTNEAVDVTGPEADLSEQVAGAQTSEKIDLHEEEDYAEDVEPGHSYDQNQAPEFVDGAFKEDPDVLDQPDEGAEDGSNSSHTVEGDLAEAANQNASFEAPGAESGDLYEFNEQAEDLFQPDEDTLAPQADYDAYGDEELFAAQDDTIEADGQNASEDTGAEDRSSTLQEASEQDLSQDIAPLAGNGEHSDKSNLQLNAGTEGIMSGNLSPPLTPQQDKKAKRKAEDDDELLFLDLDTPDPKRRRPS